MLVLLVSLQLSIALRRQELGLRNYRRPQNQLCKSGRSPWEPERPCETPFPPDRLHPGASARPSRGERGQLASSADSIPFPSTRSQRQQNPSLPLEYQHYWIVASDCGRSSFAERIRGAPSDWRSKFSCALNSTIGSHSFHSFFMQQLSPVDLALHEARMSDIRGNTDEAISKWAQLC